MAILRNDHTHRSSNSFNECLAIPFSILALHFCWRPAQKHVACLLSCANMHVGSKVIDMYMRMLNDCVWGIHCEHVHLVYIIQHHTSTRAKNSSDYNFDSYIANTAWQKLVVDQEFHGSAVYKPNCPWETTPTLCCTALQSDGKQFRLELAHSRVKNFFSDWYVFGPRTSKV